MQKKIIESILMDDLEKARSLLKQSPAKFELLSDLLIKTTKRQPPFRELKSKIPSNICIQVSYVCSQRCKMCNSGFQNRTTLFDDYKNFLPEEFYNILPWIKPTSKVWFVGMGETLNSPYIYDFLKKSNNNISFLTTSGVPLNRSRIQSFIELRLDFLNISFDGKSSVGHGSGKEGYVKNIWKKIEMIQRVKKEQRSKLPILVLNITINGENISQLQELITTALKHNIRKFILFPMTINSKALFNKSIFGNYEKSKKRINAIISYFNEKGITIRINEQKRLYDSVETCPYIDNILIFYGKSNVPKVCCGNIAIPLETSNHSVNKYWNSFPFRYFRYLHFCSESKMLPLICQACWAKDLKQYSRTCSSLYKRENSLMPITLYQRASRFKRDNRIKESKKLFQMVLSLTDNFSLKGKTYCHLGEIKIKEKNYHEALSYMKLAVQHCFDHQKAFAYLYLLLMFIEQPAVKKRRKKFNLNFYSKPC